MAFFIWGVLALGLAGVVVFSSQLEFLVPAVAAVIVLAISLIPGLEANYLVQTAVWLVLSGGGLVAFRNRLRRLRQEQRQAAEDPAAGKRAIVTEEITAETPGRVRFQATTWSAVSSGHVPVGAEVLILGQDGLVLQVERTEKDRLEEELRALETRVPSKEE